MQKHLILLWLLMVSGHSLALDWTDPSMYLDHQRNCQQKLADLKWENTLWPAENKQPKPTREAVFSDEEVEENIRLHMRMESILAQHFKSKIEPDMLQDELQRMANTTKDPAQLKKIFEALSHDPRSLIECLVRPNLVSKVLQEQYHNSHEIHQLTRKQAEAEWLRFQHHGEVPVSAEVQLVEYRVRGSDLAGHQEQNPLKEPVIELNKTEFSEMVAELTSPGLTIEQQLKNQNSKLKESKHAFFVQELLSHAGDEISVRTWIWQKQPLSAWLAKQSIQGHINIFSQSKFYLPVITGSDKAFDGEHVRIQGGSQDIWYLPEGAPTARQGHTAVWTGTEMIVWGRYGFPTETGGRYNPVTDSWRATAVLGGPAPRYNHTAIWTGTEMIIWGGFIVNQVLNSGSAYNPMTDSWTEIPMDDAPVPRTDHTAVWSGSEMIVWGGQASSSLTESGGRYDPGSNSWTAISQVNAPTGRVQHTAVWADGVMLVWGGYDGNATNTGGAYNPTTDNWSSITLIGAPSARDRHTAIWTGDEMVIWGGDEGANYTATGGRYDPVSDQWLDTNTSNAPTARTDHVGVWSGSEMIVWGGNDSSYTATGGRYDPLNDTWAPTSVDSAPAPRWGESVVWTGDEMIVWGGAFASIAGNPETNTGGRYDPMTDSWSSTSVSATMPSTVKERSLHTSVWTGNELIIWGGDNEVDGILASGARYHPATNQWQDLETTNEPASRYLHTAVWTGTEMIVWGGFDGSNYLNTGAHYDPLSNTWQPTNQTFQPSGRFGHTAIWTGSKMLVWGGFDGQNLVNTGGLYDPKIARGSMAWEDVELVNAPSPRYYHTAIWTGDEMIVWGGVNASDSLQTGGRYDVGTQTWSTTTIQNAPSKRQFHTAVWTGYEMLIWGGTDDGEMASGSGYDPNNNTWDAMTLNFAPQARQHHTAVWSGSEMIVWGGFDGTDAINTGGRYNPIYNLWYQTTTTDSPSSAYLHVAEWIGDRMLVFGGRDNDSFSSELGIYIPDIAAIDVIFNNGFE